MTDWINQIIEQLGYFGIFLLMLVENVFPPIPSEVILPLSGFFASQAKLDVSLVLISATLGSLTGAVFWYGIGFWFGQDKTRSIIKKHGRWLAITLKEYEKISKFFERHAAKSVFFARMVPTFRTLISVPAGIIKMNFGKFIFYSALGTIIWNALLFYIGYTLQARYEIIETPMKWATDIIIGGVILLYLYRLATHKNRP